MIKSFKCKHTEELVKQVRLGVSMQSSEREGAEDVEIVDHH